MKHKITTKEFLTKVKKVHGDCYDYSETFYRGSKEKIKVICYVHGPFYPSAGNHLRKSGCPLCARGNFGRNKKEYASKTFVKDSNRVHNNKYDYSLVKYVNAHQLVKIICPTHGMFEMRPYCHRQGQGCPKCGKLSMAKKHSLSTDEFIQRVSKKHSDKYDYSFVNYEKSDKKVQIICPEHGPFFQRPQQHLRGEGCPECGKESWFAEQGGYSSEYFSRNPEEMFTSCIFYLVEFFNEQERFFKIGLTKRSIKQRFHWGYNKYDMIVHLEQKTELHKAFLAEQKILYLLKTQRYIPKIKIGGWTECLSKFINLTDIKNIIVNECF